MMTSTVAQGHLLGPGSCRSASAEFLPRSAQPIQRYLHRGTASSMDCPVGCVDLSARPPRRLQITGHIKRYAFVQFTFVGRERRHCMYRQMHTKRIAPVMVPGMMRCLTEPRPAKIEIAVRTLFFIIIIIIINAACVTSLPRICEHAIPESTSFFWVRDPDSTAYAMRSIHAYQIAIAAAINRRSAAPVPPVC